MKTTRLAKTVALSAALVCGVGWAQNTTNLTASGELIVSFRDVGSHTWVAPMDISGATVLIVGGGGGGGGGTAAGGGGGGQVILASNQTFTAGTAYALTVGAGGAGGVGKASGTTGGASSFAAFTADGGGAGDCQDKTTDDARVGANGGGDGAQGGSVLVEGTGATKVEDSVYWYGGHAGGSSTRGYWAGGGGGGALTDGGSATEPNVGCTGGDGLALDITGEAVVYACGGGGGVNVNLGNGIESYKPGKGGSDGVSGGSALLTGGEDGLVNTGTGGGGGSYPGSGSALKGGAGGSGVVVIRYRLTSAYADVSGFEGLLDGTPKGATIGEIWPTEGATIWYAADGDTNWTTEPITFSTAGTHTIRVKVMADGLADYETSVTVSLTDEPGIMDGSVALVAPAGSSTPTEPYATWATAANDLQTAIDAVTAGGTVYVANGTYALEKTIYVTKTITLRGFDRTSGAADPEKVVLDGQDTVRCVLMTGDAYRPVFNGLKFYRGKGVTDGDVTSVGGGVFISGATGSFVPTHAGEVPSLVNCIFEGCSAKQEGAALHVRGRIYVENCRFVGNQAETGNYGNTVSVREKSGAAAATAFLGCTFVEDQASIPGNACTFALRGFGNLVSNCTFKTCGKSAVIGSDSKNANAENSVIVNCVSLDAGAPFLAPIEGQSYGGMTLRNCLIARGSGYGLVTGTGKTVIDNCTITGNGKAGIRVKAGTADAPSVCTVRNTIAWNNNGAKADLAFGEKDAAAPDSTTMDYTETTSSTGWDGATSTAAANAVDPRFKDAAKGDYSLKRRTPHLDKGTILDWMTAETTDLAGNPRVATDGKPLAKDAAARPDLGCYENQDVRMGMCLIIR